MQSDLETPDPDLRPDPIRFQRAAKCLIAIAAGLHRMISGIVLMILGVLILTHQDVLLWIWFPLLGIHVALTPLMIRRSRARRGLGFTAMGDHYHSDVHWKVSLSVVAIMLMTALVGGFAITLPRLFAMYPTITAISCIITFGRLRMWEYLWDGGIGLLIAVGIVVNPSVHILVPALLITGLGLIVSGASFEMRWVRWSSRHVGDATPTAIA